MLTYIIEYSAHADPLAPSFVKVQGKSADEAVRNFKWANKITNIYLAEAIPPKVFERVIADRRARGEQHE